MASCTAVRIENKNTVAEERMCQEFYRGVSDYKSVYGESIAPLMPVIAGLRVTYRIPATLKPLIQRGPALGQMPKCLTTKDNFSVEGQLASICLQLMNAKQCSFLGEHRIGSVKFQIYSIDDAVAAGTNAVKRIHTEAAIKAGIQL